MRRMASQCFSPTLLKRASDGGVVSLCQMVWKDGSWRTWRTTIAKFEGDRCFKMLQLLSAYALLVTFIVLERYTFGHRQLSHNHRTPNPPQTKCLRNQAVQASHSSSQSSAYSPTA